MKCFRKAAEQGEPGAFHYMGAAYYLGKEVKKDDVQHYKWTLIFRDPGRSVIPDGAAPLDAQVKEIEGS